MGKKFGGNRKWTTGRSRVVRPTDQQKMNKGVRESLKVLLNKLKSR